jgi:hypothetical protein
LLQLLRIVESAVEGQHSDDLAADVVAALSFETARIQLRTSSGVPS